LGKHIKKIQPVKIILIFIFFISFKLFSQKEFDTEIESNSRPGILYYFTWKPSNKPKVRKYDRFIFDVYYTDARDPKNIIKKSTSNIGFTVNFMQEFALNKKNTISIGTGLGLTNSKANLNSNLILGKANTIILSAPLLNYKKNVLNEFNINIPIELRFRTKGWSHYKIHFGGRIGYQVRLNEKYFFEDSKVNYRTSLKKAAENFTYSVHTRIGVRNYSFYASYNLNPLFKHSESPKMNWFQLGCSISLF